MHFGDTIVIFVLALILFGPKKLPEIGRQIAKLLAEFRRASNEFKLQIDDELRALEQQERQKQIAAEAAAVAQPASTPSEASSTPVIQPPSTGEPVSAASPYAPPDRYRHEETSEARPEDTAESRLEGPAPDLMEAAAEAPILEEAAPQPIREPLEASRNGLVHEEPAGLAPPQTENAHHHG